MDRRNSDMPIDTKHRLNSNGDWEVFYLNECININRRMMMQWVL